MPSYRRVYHPGGTYFFKVNLLERGGNELWTGQIDQLRDALFRVRIAHPFEIDGWVVLPENNSDFTLRWRLIKARFSKSLPWAERRSAVRMRRGERGTWQRGFWEHLIRDEADHAAHMDYVHFNPIKHGPVKRVIGWPYSTFQRLVDQGLYPCDWAGGPSADALAYDD